MHVVPLILATHIDLTVKRSNQPSRCENPTASVRPQNARMLRILATHIEPALRPSNHAHGQRHLNPTNPLGLGSLAWYVCFEPLFISTLRISSLWERVYLSPYPITWTSDPLGLGMLELLIATFWPSCCHSVFHGLFDADFVLCLLDFGPNLASQIYQNRSRIDAKMHSHIDLNFYGVLIDFCSELGPPRTSKNIKIQLFFICFFDFRCFQDNIHLGLHLGANMAPFKPPKSSQ